MGPEASTSGGGGSIHGHEEHGHEELAPPFFYHSSPDTLPYGWEPYGIYERADDDEVLGLNVTPLSDGDASIARCFNCGDPDHKVTECPFRLNRELVSLARQYYQFYQGNVTAWKRLHSVEAWLQQRLDWLEEFEPGKIKGELLKEALRADYGNEDEWLKNISVWGYPRGWVSDTDPRERVRTRIWKENEGNVDDDLEDDIVFEIHRDEDVTETLSFQDAFCIVKNAPEASSPSRSRRSRSLSNTSNPESPRTAELIRWAQHPSSYFSFQHLVLYSPPVPRESWSSTIFENTDAYLQQFYRPPPAPPAEEPPPLPPTSAPPLPGYPPPPLDHPPPPPSPPTPLPHLRKIPNNEHEQLAKDDDLSEADMDFSDAD